MLITECLIRPSHTSDDHWECLPNEEQTLIEEAISSMREKGEVYDLGEHKLPEGVADIRGLIFNEPDKVFYIDAYEEPGYYYGIKL